MPPRCPGSTVRSSAAPSAANAIARGHGRPRLSRRVRTGRRPTGEPVPTSLWAAAVPSPQMQRPKQSSRAGSSAQAACAVHPVSAGARRGLRIVQELHGERGKAVDLARQRRALGWRRRVPGPCRRCSSRARAGVRRNRHARTCRGGLSSATGGRISGTAGWRSYQRRPLGEKALCQSQIRSGHDRPRHRGANRAPPRPWSRRAAARSGAGAGPTASAPGRRGRRRSPAPLARSSTACGKAVATTGRPLAMASTKTPEVT